MVRYTNSVYFFTCCAIRLNREAFRFRMTCRCTFGLGARLGCGGSNAWPFARSLHIRSCSAVPYYHRASAQSTSRLARARWILLHRDDHVAERFQEISPLQISRHRLPPQKIPQCNPPRSVATFLTL